MEPSKIPQINTPIKFTEIEMGQIGDIKSRYTSNVMNFGQLFLQRKKLDEVEITLLKEKSELETTEKEFLKNIISKYGEGTFDPKTGLFTPKTK